MYVKYEEMERGKGFWKLDMSHLKIPEYVFKINNVISKAFEEYSQCSPNIIWEMVKCEVSAASIDFSTRFVKSTRINTQALF